MGRLSLLALAAVLLAFAGMARAETGSIERAGPQTLQSADPATPEDVAKPEAEPVAAPAAAAPAAVAEPTSPVGIAIKARLALIPEDGTEPEKKERAALAAFYAARSYAPLWVDAKGFTAEAAAVTDAFAKAGDWGLDSADFVAPKLDAAEAGHLSPETQAVAEVELARVVLKYARFARGGRILDLAGQLNSNLDRKPQLLDPAKVLDGLAAAPDKGAFLVGTHPQHAQFQRLREKYAEAIAKTGGKPNAAAKRLLANMEMWRWMHDDLGALHLFANVPSYMIDIVKDGTPIHSERIVVGETGKQSSIFTRPLKSITFRPMWRVPESIKVNELWPSLLRGGGLMRSYGLEVETKDGRRLDWRTMDWRTLDIRDYEVVQPSGRKSVMGYVKFSFPSQHTIFMHDTPDKWMFNAKQRTLSHGCLRLRNPLRVAEILLAEDKGWDAAKIDELAKQGPFNNEVAIDKPIKMHIAYFTAWVDDDGKLTTYSDIYGHEKRVTQALDGKWDQIAKGRDHLAPPVPDQAHLEDKPVKQARSQPTANDDFLGSFLGGF
ncbi:MAG: L,D-transpeptidase family protein [Hyphomicrobium sp.]|uniref:L,D-transpeptidase family protein n=1 Tax=Hyphomicrobium sp. TaxID=82 RepID=UPI003D0C5E45